MSRAFVFPGQGAQAVGMGADFFDSPLCARANEICGFDLVALMRAGPEARLQETTVSQPALFLHSALVVEALAAAGGPAKADWYVGLSLGEYTALYAAGVLDFAQALEALVVRGRAMQQACESTRGGMASVIGLDDAVVEEVCAQACEGEVLQIANHNCPGQAVISGTPEALARALPLLTEAGARRVIPLKVAGAFHSPLMAAAAGPLERHLAGVRPGPGAGRVIANVTARPHDEATLVETLVAQVSGSVRLSDSIRFLREECGVNEFWELGSGTVLGGLIRRTVEGVTVRVAGTRAQVAVLCTAP